MRILLDSSVLIAAIARPGVCTELVDEIARHHALLSSQYILEEVQRKLITKFAVPSHRAAALVHGIRQQCTLVGPVTVPVDSCRDPEDLPILAAALGGEADLLVTVDKDLLSLQQFRGIPIIKPGDFWRRGFSLEK